MSRRPASQYGWLAYYRELIGSWAKGNSRRHAAEDAAHDAVTSVLAQDHHAILDPKAYLYRASNNRLLNEIRRETRRELVSLEDLAEDDHPLFDGEMLARTRELAHALEKALARLPPKKREAYILHRLEGYTQVEIAQRMGVSLNSVERYIIDAAFEIRKQLEGFCPTVAR